jgi:hypothetical protein
MIKDDDYYRSLDLHQASEEIRRLGDDRGNHEVFGEAINSLLVAAKERAVTDEEVLGVLGPPDRVRSNELGEVWNYDWSDMYGPIRYTSSTPFQFVNGQCRGIVPRVR